MHFPIILTLLALSAHGFSIELAPDLSEEDDVVDVSKRLYIVRDGYNHVKRSQPDINTFGQLESLEDGHAMDKRLYRLALRPAKRSMAIGRAGMRPGKRSGKRLPESYFPFNRFFYFEE